MLLLMNIFTQSKINNMTLQQLIDDGLQVGTLVLHEMGVYLQLHENNVWFIPTMNEYLSEKSYFYTSDKWQPTTAHDCDIDPQTLPIEEPFWTGWVMFNGVKTQVLEFVEGAYWSPQGFDDEGYQEPNYFKFNDGSGCYEYECRPCLPPK